MMTAIPAPMMYQALWCINYPINPHNNPKGRGHNYSHCTEEGTSSEMLGNLPKVAGPVLGHLGWEPGQTQRQLWNHRLPL